MRRPRRVEGPDSPNEPKDDKLKERHRYAEDTDKSPGWPKDDESQDGGKTLNDVCQHGNDCKEEP